MQITLVSKVHSDLKDPANFWPWWTQVLQYVTFTDGRTRYTRLEILRTEGQVLGAYKVFATWGQAPEASGLTAAVSSPASSLPNLFESGVLIGVLQPPTPRSILAWSGLVELLNRRSFECVRSVLY